MFFGTIDSDVRRYLAAHSRLFNDREIVVGCSGNFTSEKLLHVCAKPKAVHANDVSLYTQVIAEALTGTPEGAYRVAPTEVERYAFIREDVEGGDPWRRAAAILVLLRVVQHEKCNSLFKRTRWDQYVKEWPDLVAATVEKLKKAAFPVSSYFSGDVFEHFQRWQGRDVVYMAYFPFIKGDYERQYKRIGQIVQWPEPTYPMLDQARIAACIDWLLVSGQDYLFLLGKGDTFNSNQIAVDRGLEPLMVSNQKRHTFNFLYSNMPLERALFRRPYQDTGKRFKLLKPDFPFQADTRCEIVPVSSSDIQYYKGLFLARNIDFTAGELGFAVVLDGQVAGFIEMSHSKREYGDRDLWYMLSDFPIEPKFSPYASKLVVMLSLSREIHRFLDLKYLKRSRWVLTTARTHRPVSMKYRGVYKLDKRGEGFLNYKAQWSDKPAQEIYREWWTRYVKNSKR